MVAFSLGCGIFTLVNCMICLQSIELQVVNFLGKKKKNKGIKEENSFEERKSNKCCHVGIVVLFNDH